MADFKQDLGTLPLAMTKSDYDKFVEEKGRTPGDAKWFIAQRGQVRTTKPHQDPQVRSTDRPNSNMVRSSTLSKGTT